MPESSEEWEAATRKVVSEELRSHVRDVEDVQKDLANVKVSVSGLKGELETVSKRFEKPIYKDVRFWIGLAAIPAIVASAWAYKYVVGSPALIREVHRFLGTEPALVVAFSEEGNALRSAVSTSTNHALRGAVDAALRSRGDVMHADIMRLGFLIERASQRGLDCRENSDVNDLPRTISACAVPQSSRIDSAISTFRMPRDTKVNVSVWVNVQLLAFDERGYFDRTRQTDVTRNVDIKDILTVDIAGQSVTLASSTARRPTFTEVNVQGRKYLYSRYERLGIDLPRVEDLPLQPVSVSLADDANVHYFVTVLFVVSEPANDSVN